MFYTIKQILILFISQKSNIVHYRFQPERKLMAINCIIFTCLRLKWLLQNTVFFVQLLLGIEASNIIGHQRNPALRVSFHMKGQVTRFTHTRAL